MMRRLVAVLVILGACAGAWAQNPPLALRASAVHVGDGTVIENGIVVMRDGKIVAVGKDVALPKGCVQRAFDGHITPGLIDPLSSFGLPGNAAEEISEIVPQHAVVDEIDFEARVWERLAREGVTTVYVSSPARSVIGGPGCIVKSGTGPPAARIVVPRANLRLSLDRESQFGNRRPFGRRPPTVFARRGTTLMGTVWVAREALQAARAAAAESDESVENPAVAALRGVFAKGARPLRAFTQQQFHVETALGLAEEFGLRLQLERPREIHRSLELVKKAGCPVIYGPVESSAIKRGARGRLSAPKLMHDAGITFALTAAGGLGDAGLSRQAMFAIRYGLDSEAALLSVTSRAAEMLGVGDRVGSLKPGLDADVVVWSGAPFAPDSRQDQVYIAGRKASGRAF